MDKPTASTQLYARAVRLGLTFPLFIPQRMPICWLHVPSHRHFVLFRYVALKLHGFLNLQFGSLDFWFDIAA